MSLLDDFLDASQDLTDPLRVTLFNVGGTEINTVDVLEFVLVFIVAYTLGRISETSIRKFGSKHNSLRIESLEMLAKFIHWGILIVGVLIGLSLIGLPVTHLAILVSALSVGVGFGLQTIVNNSIAGLLLLSEKAVTVGDIIGTPSGRIGKVTMVTIRATKIITPTGEAILIPNASLIDKAFTNYSMDSRGVRKAFPFSVPYGIDFRKVKEVIEKAAIQVPYCIKPDKIHEVECGITGFGNFGINAELVVWVDPVELMEPYRLESTFLSAINDACVANNIIIPGPSYGVTVSAGTQTGFSAQISGSTAAVPKNLAVTSIVGYPQSDIEGTQSGNEEGEEKEEGGEEEEDSSNGADFLGRTKREDDGKD